MNQLTPPIAIGQLRPPHNYVQFKTGDNYFVRVLGIHPALLLLRRYPSEPPTYLLDVIDPITRKYRTGLNMDQVEAIPVTPDLLIRLGFTVQPAGIFPTHLDCVYTYTCDTDSYWAVCFDGAVAELRYMLNGVDDFITALTSLHHLQNLLFDLDDIQLRLDCDQDTVASDIATRAVNGASEP